MSTYTPTPAILPEDRRNVNEWAAIARTYSGITPMGGVEYPTGTRMAGPEVSRTSPVVTALEADVDRHLARRDFEGAESSRSGASVMYETLWGL